MSRVHPLRPRRVRMQTRKAALAVTVGEALQIPPQFPNPRNYHPEEGRSDWDQQSLEITRRSQNQWQMWVLSPHLTSALSSLWTWTTEKKSTQAWKKSSSRGRRGVCPPVASVRYIQMTTQFRTWIGVSQKNKYYTWNVVWKMYSLFKSLWKYNFIYIQYISEIQLGIYIML